MGAVVAMGWNAAGDKCRDKYGLQCCACGIEGGCGRGHDDTGVLAYVGGGEGDYVAETTYRFVGQGAGDVKMVERSTQVTAPWCNAWCKWLIVAPMVVLIAGAIILSRLGHPTMSQPRTLRRGIPPTPIVTPQSCSIFGDPHVLTFDGQKVDFYTAGEFYIVKSETVVIQGKYAPTHATNGLSVTRQLAVGGPFLQGHTLIIGEEHAIWDGQRIVLANPSEWRDPAALCHMVYNSEGEILQADREGKPLNVLHITLPSSVTIEVNRWNDPREGRYINVKITMPPQPGQDGDCGNFNGEPLDDKRFVQRARVGKDGVPAPELLFLTPKTIVNKVIEDCEDEVLASAHEQCKAITTNFWPKMSCLVEVCHGRPAA